MTMRCTWFLAIAVVLLSVSLRAQILVDDGAYDPDDPTEVAVHEAAARRADMLFRNYHKLTYTLTVDRNTPYFPEEAIKIEIRIANPTSSPLEIPDPNDPRLQCFTGHVEEWCRVPFNPPSTVIGPGQVIILTADSEDLEVSKHWGLIGAASWFHYLLGGSVDLEVGTPILEASELVPVHTTRISYPMGPGHPSEILQEAAMVVAVQLAEEHVILVGTRNTTTGYKVKPEKDGTFRRGISGCAPWVRLATLPTAVTILKATADEQDRITIQYTAGGATRTMHLDEKRHPTD